MENAQALRHLLEAQQDHMIREMASNHGITDSARQDAFVQSFRQLQSSPFFEDYPPWRGMVRAGPRLSERPTQ